MKTFILLTLTVAGLVHVLEISKHDIQDALCSHYWQVDNPRLYWPVCDPWWTDRPGHYGDD
jgi:hypothetical protein